MPRRLSSKPTRPAPPLPSAMGFTAICRLRGTACHFHERIEDATGCALAADLSAGHFHPVKRVGRALRQAYHLSGTMLPATDDHGRPIVVGDSPGACFT